MNTLSPDEALYAFMDGELEIHDEQRLFDALAGNPELRTEMKDILSIRNAVHRDVLFPSPAVESGILAAAGLAPAAAPLTAVGTAVAGASSWLASLTPLLYTAGGVIAGALVMLSVLRAPQGTTTDMMAAGPSNTVPPSSADVVAGRPAEAAPPVIVRVDTVYVRKVIVPVEPQERPLTVATTSDASAPQPTPADESTDSPVVVSSAPIASPDVRSLQSTSASNGIMTASPISPRTAMNPVILGFRTLASGLNAAEPTPQAVQDAMLPNTAFSLTIPLSAYHRVGVEMGSESFTQTFSGTDGIRPAEWQQTPVLFWLGATYQFTPWNLELLPGLSPFAQATVGAAFSQGPVGRGTVGLAYQPIGPVRMTVGLDGSALFYQFQNSWFTTTKWGLSYGLSVDLGGWR